MDYYMSKFKQALALLLEPKVSIVIGVILLATGIVVGRANNTQAGTGIFLVIGICLIFMGLFGMSGGMWNF